MGKIINKVCSVPNGKYFVFLFLFLLVLFSARFMVTGYGVGGDGEGYYAYLPSVIIDKDLDFKNQYLSGPWLNSTNPFKDTEEGSAHLIRKTSNRTATGYLTNPFPIGSAILWLPFFILSLSLIHFLNLFGLNITLNGYSALSQYVTMVGSIFYVILGFILTYKLIKKFCVDPGIIKSSIFLILIGTFAIQYFAIEPSMSHANDFFIITLFFYYFYINFILTDNKAPYKKWIIFGVISGLMVLVRPQNALLIALPLIYSIALLIKNRSSAKKELINYAIFFSTFLISLLPLLISWKIIYGSFLTIPQGVGPLLYFSPQIPQVLFSFRHSLFVSTPLLIFSIIGFTFLFKDTYTDNKKKEAYHNTIFLILLVLAFLSQLYINSIIVRDWWAGDSFGARRFVGLMFIFVLGFSYFLNKIRTKKIRYFVYFIFAIFVFLNILYNIEYNLLIISRSEPITYLEIVKALALKTKI